MRVRKDRRVRNIGNLNIALPYIFLYSLWKLRAAINRVKTGVKYGWKFSHQSQPIIRQGQRCVEAIRRVEAKQETLPKGITDDGG